METFKYLYETYAYPGGRKWHQITTEEQEAFQRLVEAVREDWGEEVAERAIDAFSNLAVKTIRELAQKVGTR